MCCALAHREPLSCATTVASSVKYCMHTLEFDFHTITNEVAIDALVYALSIEMLTQCGIESYQPCANRLQFESAAHCTLATLALANRSRYTINIVD